MQIRARGCIACLIAAGCACVAVCFRTPDAKLQPVVPDIAGLREMAGIGGGFLVWERRVGDSWQIWMKQLDGSGVEERLVPAEPGRDHFCPKISPDGTRLAYMSYEQGSTPYEPGLGVLWLMDLATRRATVLSERARSYREDRAVVWFDDRRLCHVDETGNAVELDLSTMSRTTLTRSPHKKHGWLVNPQKTHVTSGDPEFAVLEPDGRIHAQPKQGGCQPYFSSDGRWGFWMGGAGGPINKVFLPTRETGQILDLDDPSMPPGRNYLYFPMLSHCQRLMVFAASADAHDHAASDYDVFAVRMDPETLEPVGRPVRCTVFEGNDRFPDVFCRELPLGSHFVEGTTRLELHAPGDKLCQWTVDGEVKRSGSTLVHEFSGVGDHWVSATDAGGTEHRGLVHIRAVKAPAVQLVRREEKQALCLTFDEAVSLAAATAETNDGRILPWGAQSAERHCVRLCLPDGIDSGAGITLRGVRDLAQQPNEMPPASIRVPGEGWPQSREGLLFAWQNRHQPSTGLTGSVPEREGKAFWR